YIAKDQSDRRVEAVTSVVVDRILGLYGMVLLAIMTMLFNLSFVLDNTSLTGVLLSSSLLWMGMSAFIGGSLSRTVKKGLKVQERLEKLPLGPKLFSIYDAFHSYRNHLGAVFAAVGLSLCAQITAVFFMIFVGAQLGAADLSWATYFFSVPIGFIVASFPIAPAGVGVGQYAFLVLFELYSGEKTNIGQTAITAFQVFLFIWGLVGGYFYLKKKQPKQLEEALS
ncbi:MAG: flippase-like domain-containing protein, partial [Bdellovibrionales bacterium]|nr:flippase-like domain-containing protein [Bdellovibrionales bacterium]